MNRMLRIVFASALLALGTGVLAQGTTPAPIATQDTNVDGVTAEVIEFKRKGNTLTAKVKLRNASASQTNVAVHYDRSYVLDADAGKKYEVLKDDKNVYIGALSGGYDNRFMEDIPAGQAKSFWMKFPAPPAEVKAVTLQLDGIMPFEDLPITDQ